jgi:cytosine/adenosine deaminase-related metal-dependent hydrolase
VTTGSRTFALRARHVLPIAASPLDGGWIRVEHGMITAVGKGSPPATCRDLGDCIVLPGLVNAHTHLEFSALGAPFDVAGGLPEWIGRVVAWRRAREAGADPARAVRNAIATGLAESVAAGVTTIGDIATSVAAYDHPPTGPRLRVFREGLGLVPATIETAARTVARDLDRLARAGIAAGISPHAPYTVAAPLGRRLLAPAQDRGHSLPVAMHLAESEAEEELLTRGTGPFRDLLESLGAWDAARPPRLLPTAEWISRLARGTRGIVVHATHLGRDPDALARLARHRHRLCVAICPRTTRAMSAVLPPLALLRAAGVRVCLGTDGRGSNPDLSILAECRTLVDAGLASPTEALAMATLHGVWALGFDRRCGAISAGRAADLVILRPAQSRADPATAALDPATKIVAVLCSGRLIHGALP